MIAAGQILEARELLEWSRLTLARKAHVRVATLRRAELVDGAITAVQAAKLQRALEAAGVEFTNGDQPGVRLRKVTQ